MITGHQLRLLRLLKDVKQKTIARHLNISQQAYSKLEKAEHINGEKLEKIIKALGLTPPDFEKIIENLPPQNPEKIK